MQLTGLVVGSKLLRYVDFPCAEVLGPESSADAIKDLAAKAGRERALECTVVDDPSLRCGSNVIAIDLT